MEITQEQREQLTTWAGQRDSLLGEISTAKIELESIQKKINDLTESGSEIVNRHIQLTGSISTLEKVELDRANLISKDILDLSNTKTRLEINVNNLQKEIISLIDKKENLHSDIKIAVQLHNQVFNRASVLDQVVDRVVRINEKNIQDVNVMIDNLSKDITIIASAVENTHSTLNKSAADLNGVMSLAKEKIFSAPAPVSPEVGRVRSNIKTN